MNILVTGCNGFIGRNMISFLKETTDWNIEGWTWGDEYPDIVRYDWVIHLGAETNEDATTDVILEKNLEFSQWMYNECQQHGVHLQYASTYEVYGNSNNYCEYVDCKPNNTVAWSKYLFDKWAFRKPHTSYVHGFRYFKVYGKWMHLNKHQFTIWKEQAVTKKEIEVDHAISKINYDWVWVGDICKLHYDFICNVKGSGIWNVGTGLSHPTINLANEYAELEGATVVVSNHEAESKYKKVCADLTQLKETIGKRKWLNVYEWIRSGG